MERKGYYYMNNILANLNDDMLKDCTENLGLIRSIAQGR